MKRAVVLILLAVFLLTGCAAETLAPQEPYTQYVGNTPFLVDPVAKTITANGHVFTYRYIDEGNTKGVSVTYPNGAVVTESYEYSSDGIGAIGSTSWSNADATFVINNGADYIDCYMLLSVVPEQTQEKERFAMWPSILLGLVFIAIGAWMFARPHIHWKWTHGWMYKNAEPSDLALGVSGAMGIIGIILGIVLILIGIFA